MALLGGQLAEAADPVESAVMLQDEVADCERGEGWRCYNAALDYYIGESGLKDRYMSLVLAKRGCELGYADGCGHYAYVLYFQQRDGVPTAESGLKQAKWGCRVGNPLNTGLWCSMASAILSRNGEHEEAAAWAWEGCMQGKGYACEQVGSFYWRDGSDHARLADNGILQQGYADRPGKARVAFEVGCMLEHKTACGSLGAMLATENRMEVNNARAAFLLNQSCESSQSYKREYHCELLGDLLALHEHAGAFGVYEENCSRYGGLSCAKAAKLNAET